MENQIVVPGVIYSLLLALGAWAVDYFTGSGYVWAPILLATVPILLKMFTVATGGEPPAGTARGAGSGAAPRGKMSKLFLG